MEAVTRNFPPFVATLNAPRFRADLEAARREAAKMAAQIRTRHIIPSRLKREK